MAEDSQKRARFSEESVNALAEFVRQCPQQRLPVTDMHLFYEAFPQYKQSVHGKIKAIVKHHPSLIRLEAADSGMQYIHSPVDDARRVESAASEGSRMIIDENFEHAVDSFTSFLNTECEGGTLSEKHLGVFYAKHPECQNAFAGKTKLLSKYCKDEFVIESASNGTGFQYRLLENPGNPKAISRVEGIDEPTYAVTRYSQVREALEMLKPFDQFVVDVEGDFANNRIAFFYIRSRSLGVFIDMRVAPFDLRDLQVLFADKNKLIICFDVITVQKFVKLCRIEMSSVFDLLAAWKVLGMSQANTTVSLGDLVQEYDIKVDFVPWSEVDPLSEVETSKTMHTMIRSTTVLWELFDRMWEDAYSRSKTNVCLQASKKALERPSFVPSKGARLLRNPTSKASLETTTFEKEAHSFQAKLSAAKRSVEASQLGLPSNACIEFHVRSPGSCSKGAECKFKHSE